MKQIKKYLYKIIFLVALILMVFGIKSIYGYDDTPNYSSNWYCAEPGQDRGYFEFYTKKSTIVGESSDGIYWHMLRIYC